MPLLHLPVSVTYDTHHTTPIKDIVAALVAADALLSEAVEVLPSFVSGTDFRLVSVNVQRLSQESPLKEILIAAIYVTVQKEIEGAVTTLAKDTMGLDVPAHYQTLLTIAVLVVLFYGVGLAKDVVSGFLSEGPAKRKLHALVADVAAATGIPAADVTKILDAKYAKPSAVKSLARNAVAFFRPSQREGSTRVDVGDVRIEPTIVADVPLGDLLDDEQTFERFKPYPNVTLELHAQDIDKGNTGWAAVPKGISERRLRMKLMPPVEPSDIWGKTRVVGDIVVISRATPSGYEPSEIHLTSVEAAE